MRDAQAEEIARRLTIIEGVMRMILRELDPTDGENTEQALRDAYRRGYYRGRNARRRGDPPLNEHDLFATTRSPRG